MLHPLLVLNLHENNHNFSKASFNWKGNLCNTNHCKFAILNRCSSTSIASDSSRQDKRPAYRLGWLYRTIAHLLPAEFLLSSSKSRLHHATAKSSFICKTTTERISQDNVSHGWYPCKNLFSRNNHWVSTHLLTNEQIDNMVIQLCQAKLTNRLKNETNFKELHIHKEVCAWKKQYLKKFVGRFFYYEYLCNAINKNRNDSSIT